MTVSNKGRKIAVVRGETPIRRRAEGGAGEVCCLSAACPACGKPVEAGWKVCPVCGAPIDPGSVRHV
jgi:hypothetical protein